MDRSFRVRDELHDWDSAAIFISSSQEFSIGAKTEFLTVNEQTFAVNCYQFAISADLFLEHSHSILRDQLRIEFIVVHAQTFQMLTKNRFWVHITCVICDCCRLSVAFINMFIYKNDWMRIMIKKKQLTAKDIQSTFRVRISIDNPKNVNFCIIVLFSAHKCRKSWIALQTLQFLKRWQIKYVEAATCRYYQDGLLNLKEYDLFIESKSSQYFRIFLLHNSQLFRTEVIRIHLLMLRSFVLFIGLLV